MSLESISEKKKNDGKDIKLLDVYLKTLSRFEKDEVLKLNIKKIYYYFKDNDLDLLIASRYKKNSKIINWPIKRKILSFLSNKLTKYTLKIPITDYTNGYRIYSCSAAKFIVKNCGKIGDGYIVLSEILVQLYYNNFKVDEIDTIFVNRVRGTSNATFSEILLSLFGLYKIWGEKKKNYKILIFLAK